MRRIVFVLRSGGDFSFYDVLLLKDHILGLWKGKEKPEIICFSDKAKKEWEIDNLKIKPLPNAHKGTWSRIFLYSKEVENLRPFLYIDLDTIILDSVEYYFNLAENHINKYIVLEDFYQKGKLATALVWFPDNTKKLEKVYKSFKHPTGHRMDYYLRKVIKPDLFWQQLTNTIYSSKPDKKFLKEPPKDAKMICFHGKPRVTEAKNHKWVNDYIEKDYEDYVATVIIPYKKDRGWLQEAIDSVPDNVQLLVSKGDGNWPENFNKVWNKVKGKYVRYLHEDDKLAPECIENSVKAIKEQNVDFIHGNAIEFNALDGKEKIWTSPIEKPTLQDLLKKNTIHSSTVMYKKEVFDKIGLYDETLNTAEEYEFHLRCLANGLKIGFCKQVLGYYRRHKDQKVRVVPKKYKDEEREMVRNKYRTK